MTLPTPKYHWSFNETSGTTARDSVSGAIIAIDRQSFVPGKQGNALRFNPADGARLVTTTLPQLTAPWTAGFWVKREADSDGATLFSSVQYALKLEQWQNTHKVGFTSYGGSDGTFNYTAPLNAWTHLTLVGSATDIKLYVNGQLQGTVAQPVNLGLQWLGSTQGYTEFASMILDEVKIFNQALTDAQVAELASGAPSGNTGTWSKVGGPIKAMIGGGSQLYGINPNNDIYRYDGAPEQWTKIGGPGFMFVATPSLLAGITPDKSAIYQYNGTPERWTQTAQQASDIIAGGNQIYGVLTSSNNIYRYDGAPHKWTLIGGPGYMFVAGSDFLAGISPDRSEIYRYNGAPGQWTKIGGPSRRLIAGGSQLYSIDAQSGDIFQYGGTPNNWTRIGGPGFMFAASANMLVGISPDKTQIMRYSGTPGQWTDIGDAAESIAIAGGALYAINPGFTSISKYT